MLRQLDINNSFFNDILHKNVFMRQSTGFIDKIHLDNVDKLKKSLYGLKQVVKTWFDTLSKVVLKVGFIKARLGFIKTKSYDSFPHGCFYS